MNPCISDISDINKLLEMEKQNNKNESWNKIDKSMKIQKLHVFAERYGKENSLPMKLVKCLKVFFSECLDNNKLSKSKDVIYDREKHEITSIPLLTMNANKNFTLRQNEKRQSTIKSLTPKRMTVKNEHKNEHKNEDKNEANQESENQDNI